ncbi:unnamed protein product, partial [Porites evermanni]
VTVFSVLQFSRYAALLLGLAYGYKRNGKFLFYWLAITEYNFSTFVEYLKPIAAQEREVEAARAKERAELEAIRKAEAAK